ncbi:hypothetical protein Hdeb2414_s0008g00282611 [Helianthus debilis subsp. tardiflorus]
MIESELNSWPRDSHCNPNVENVAVGDFGDFLTEVKKVLMSKYRYYLEVVLHRLGENVSKFFIC